MKVCTHCKKELPIASFYRKSKSRRLIGDGHENKCKECTLTSLRTPEKRARAYELRDSRVKKPLTEEQKLKYKETNAKWLKTTAGKVSRQKKDRKYRENNPEKVKSQQKAYRKTKAFKDSIAKYRETYPERRAANISVNNAIASGALLKPDSCSVCGMKDESIEGHHPDYTKPLEVIWVCKSCHTDYHYSRF